MATNPSNPALNSSFAPAEALRLEVADRLLRGEYQVPLLPAVAAKILEITSHDDFSLRDLSDIVITDQIIAAQVLRQANSAAFGGERRVDSLPLAIQRLGSMTLVSVVLALSMQARRPGRDLFLEQKRQIWEESAASAFIGRVVAAPSRLDRNIGFLCGLMMDFGKNVLYSLIQDIMQEDARLKAIDAATVETIITPDHPRVGRVVAERWLLPMPVSEAIAFHHDIPAAGQHQGYAAVANLTDFLIYHFRKRTPDSERKTSASLMPDHLVKHPAAKMLGINLDQAAHIIECVPECLEHARELNVK